MNEKSRLVKNTGLIAIGNFGAKMVSFLLLPLYTSILSTAEYGIYDFIVAVSAFLLPVTTMAMHEAMFRFIIDTGSKGEAFRKIISNAFCMVLAGISFLGLVFVGLSGIGIFHSGGYIWLYVTASALYTFSNNMLRGLGQIREYAIISSSKNILQLVLNVVVIAVLRWGMHGLLFSLCVSEVMAFLVVATKVKIWQQFKMSYVSAEEIRPMLRYSLPLIPNALCAQIINLSDRIIISGFMGASSNGIYSVSYKFPNMVETVYHYFYTAWSESASRVMVKGKDEAVKYYQSLHDTISNLMFSVIILMIAGMPILFRIFVRGDYVKGFDYIWILLLAMYFDSLAKFYSGLFTAVKKTKVMAISTLIAAIVNLTINIGLIHYIGLYAAAGSTLIADVVLVFFRKKYIANDIPLQTNVKDIVLKMIVAIFVVMLSCYDQWIRIGISIAIAGIYSVWANKPIIYTIIRMVKKKLKS